VGPDDAGVDLGVPVQFPSPSAWVGKAASTLAQVPSVCQRANRLETVSQGPERSGRSRHGIPVRTRNKMPLRTWRCSRQRPPRWGVIAGSKAAGRDQSYPVGAGAAASFCHRPNSFPSGSLQVANQPMLGTGLGSFASPPSSFTRAAPALMSST
jgi:hypothetical protein